MPIQLETIFDSLRRLSNKEYKARMGKFGINSENALGIPVPELRRLSKSMAKSREIAEGLWKSKIHEARILSTMVYPPEQLTRDAADEMAETLNSWDLCDHFTGNLVSNADPQLILILLATWASRKEEFAKRAAFSLIASLNHSVWYTKEFTPMFLALIKTASDDERNFVRKAIDWALREIGKSSPENNKMAIKTAHEIIEKGSKSSKWIGMHALKELNSQKVKDNLRVPK